MSGKTHYRRTTEYMAELESIRRRIAERKKAFDLPIEAIAYESGYSLGYVKHCLYAKNFGSLTAFALINSAIDRIIEGSTRLL